MKNLDAGDWIALVSAVIAGAAALVAVSQARSAKAEAASASDSAESARRQTEAVEHQTEMMSHTFYAEQEKAAESAGPTFRVVEAELVQDNQNFIKATIEMIAGQPLSSVTITGRGDEFRCLAPSVGSHEALPSKVWNHVAIGARITVIAQMEWRLSDAHADLTIDFACSEEGGSRAWQRSITASATLNHW